MGNIPLVKLFLLQELSVAIKEERKMETAYKF